MDSSNDTSSIELNSSHGLLTGGKAHIKLPKVSSDSLGSLSEDIHNDDVIHSVLVTSIKEAAQSTKHEFADRTLSARDTGLLSVAAGEDHLSDGELIQSGQTNIKFSEEVIRMRTHGTL